MVYKKLSVILVMLLFSVFAFATPSGEPDLNVLLGDANYYYPSKTTTITWSARDENSPSDANIVISYCAVTNCAAPTEIVDDNSMEFCDSILSSTSQVCSYTWTLPAGLDGNYYIDVNIFDISSSPPDDANDYSSSLYIDSNACDSEHSISSGDKVTLTSVCTGLSGDVNALGTKKLYYRTNRQGKCVGNYTTYVDPFGLSFGEFTVCFYSTDGIGNTETEKGFVHTADSDAYNIALLTEMALAALVLMLAAGFLLSREMSPAIMMMLVTAAVVIAISIYIFAVVL